MRDVRADASSLPDRLLVCLERRMFVSPTLRKLVGALPERPDPQSPQAAAVVMLVVMNAWMCLGEAALDLLGDLDAATGGLLAFAPRDARIVVGSPDDADRVRLAADALTTKLGFSPAHRTRVAQAVFDCARSSLALAGGVFELRVELEPRAARRLLLEVRLEAPARRTDTDGLEIGSAPTWSPRRIERVADSVDVRQAPDGRSHLRITFLACSRAPAGPPSVPPA